MTPKEKALDIFNRMCNSVDELLPLDVKECALIAVNELIEDNKTNEELVNGGLNKQYWEQVKKEIELL
jgi:hypothetical protein